MEHSNGGFEIFLVCRQPVKDWQTGISLQKMQEKTS